MRVKKKALAKIMTLTFVLIMFSAIGMSAYAEEENIQGEDTNITTDKNNSFTPLTTFKVDGTLYSFGEENFGGEVTMGPVVVGSSRLTIWKVDGIEIIQIIKVSETSIQGNEDTYNEQHQSYRG